MHIFRNPKCPVGMEKALLCQLAFAVFVVPALVPHWVAGIGVHADVVRYISNHQLRFRDIVALEILKIVMIQFAFYTHPIFLLCSGHMVLFDLHSGNWQFRHVLICSRS